MDGMDDTGDKLRRNVVAVSSISLAAMFFGLTIKPGVEIAGIFVAGSISPWRFWIAVFAVLTYVVLRYHFSPTRQKETEDFMARHRVAVTKRVDHYLQQSMNLSHGYKSRNELFKNFDIVAPTLFSNVNQVTPVKQLFRHWNGVYEIQVFDQVASSGSVLALPYRIPFGYRVRYELPIWARTMFYSWGFWEVLFPYILAAGAAGGIIERLLRLAMAST